MKLGLQVRGHPLEDRALVNPDGQAARLERLHLARPATEPAAPIDILPPPRYEVCGCDEVTYPSACEANRAGVSVRKYERCEPDCRSLGCAEGEVCQGCFSGFVCLPEGTVCAI